MTTRAKIAMVVAEFLGTGILATAIINVARSQIGIGYFVAFSAAITLGLLTMVFTKNGAGHFNPALTVGMWTVRKISTVNAIVAIAAQMLGGLAAWRLTEYFTGNTLSNIAGKTFDWKVLVAEMLGTFVFVFGVSAVVSQKQELGRMAATVGAALFAGVVVASVASNATVNPAVALANQSWGRAYIFGPLVGAVVAANLYAMLFAGDRELVKSAKVVSVKTTTKVTSKKAAKKPAKKAVTKKKK